MATTQLADIFDPEVFDSYSVDRVIQKSALVDCGIAAQIPQFSEFLRGPGTTMVAPKWNSIGLIEPNAAQDDPADLSTPQKFTTRTELAIRQAVNQSWSAMNLAVDVAGSDPMDAVLSQTAQYWANDITLRVFNSALGIILDNIANDAGDMVNDISSTDTGSVVDATNRFSGDAFLDADATMGEYMGELAGFLTHPVVYNNMRKQDLIDFIQDSEGDRLIPTYMGARVFHYSNCPNVTYNPGGGNIIKYYNILFAPGSFGLGASPGKNASAMDFVEAAGRGSGMEILYDRKQWVVHPAGFSFSSTTITDAPDTFTPKYADLALAANWDRSVSDRERIGMACLISNG